MLVRQRQPPTNAAVTAELGAAVVSLPSGLLAMIGDAIAKVESRLEARTASLGARCLLSLLHTTAAWAAGPEAGAPLRRFGREANVGHCVGCRVACG